jgi:hypothetical protein
LRLAECTVRAAISTIGTVENRSALVAEMRACVALYIAQIPSGWTLRGMWRRLVKAVALRISSHMLLRIETVSDDGRQSFGDPTAELLSDSRRHAGESAACVLNGATPE